MKYSYWVGLVSIVWCCAGCDALASTVVGGAITSDTVWSVGGSPYVATQSVLIMNGATLVIEPGAVVRFDPLKALSVMSGQLVARGTSGSNILFTANATPPDAVNNRWAYVGFWSNSVDAAFGPSGEYTNGCILEYAIVEYAGGTALPGAIHIESSSPYLAHSTFQNNADGGIYLAYASNLTVRANLISNNLHVTKGCGIYSTGCESIRIEGNSIIGNIGDYGAGIYIENSIDGSVSSNEVYGNISTGGAIALRSSDVMTLRDNLICTNAAGGLDVDNCDDLVLIGNTISNNECPIAVGGGVFGSSMSRFYAVSNSICHNTAKVHGAGVGYGAGVMLNVCGDAVFTENSISSNSFISSSPSALFGGGLFCQNFQGIMSKNIIIGNAAVNSGSSINGGGAFLDGNVFGPLVFSNNTVSLNVAIGKWAKGGGVYWSASGARLVENVICNNSADASGESAYGGGIYHDAAATLLIDNIVSNNTSVARIGSAFGGGIYCANCDAQLAGNSICYNSATGAVNSSGGGICFDSCSSIQSTADSMQYNAASLGGGVYLGGSDSIVLSADAHFPSEIISNYGPYQLYNDYTYTGSEDPSGQGNVDARNVWWGTTNSSEIEECIYDLFDDAGLGIAFYDPCFLGWVTNRVPIWWLQEYALGVNDESVVNDEDGDGPLNWQEYYAGTNPTNDSDFFSISSIDTSTNSRAILVWESVSNRLYTIYTHTNLLTPWPSTPTYQIQGDGTQKAYTNTEPGSPRYFKLGVELNQ